MKMMLELHALWQQQQQQQAAETSASLASSQKPDRAGHEIQEHESLLGMPTAVHADQCRWQDSTMQTPEFHW